MERDRERSRADQWLCAARRLARRLALGSWLARSVPVWLILSLGAAAVLMLLRRRGIESTASFWTVYGVGVAAVGLEALARTWRARPTASTALVWIEHKLSLNSRLTAAWDGVGEWPEPTPAAERLVRWRLWGFAPAVVFSVAILLAAALVPVRPVVEAKESPVKPPPAWAEMESWLEDVRESALVDEEALESWESKLAELEQEPAEDWYRHSNLEATDSLQEELLSEIRALERRLRRAESALDELVALEGEGEAGLESRRLSRSRLGDAVEALDLGGLPLHREVSRELQRLARDREVKRLSKEELEKLRERLRERRYDDLLREGDELYAVPVTGRPTATGSGRPGRGGLGRGPASAPISLSDNRTELGTTRIEDVRGGDVRDAGFGENVGVGIGEHDVDTSGFRPGLNAGAVRAAGEGGDIVWSQTLTPSEKRILERYFGSDDAKQ